MSITPASPDASQEETTMTTNVGFWISVFTAIVASAIVGGLYVDRALAPICQEQDTASVQEHYKQCMTNWTGSSITCADKAQNLACKKWSRP